MALRFTFLLSLFLSLTGVMIAQTIPTPTQTGTIIVNPNGNGKAEPGERIRYTVPIQNTGGANATGVQLNVVPDAKTTVVGGSFRTSPLAINDTYTCTGNVGLNVPAANGLKVNDYDDAPAGLTVVAETKATNQSGGSVTINADGSFNYTPPAGFTGTDGFTYTLEDGNEVAGVNATDAGTVTITVSNLMYFIDNSSVAATSDGRLTSPYKSLADFNAGSTAAGDVIYIENTGTNYTGGIVLANNERLFGEGHTGAANLSGVLPFTLAAHSKTLPNINGTRPFITNSAAGGILLASGNTLRGVDAGTTASGDYAIRDNGATVGSLTISEVAINNALGAFRAAVGGALNITFSSITATSGGAVNGIFLTNTSGSFNGGTGSISGMTGTPVLIDGGTVTFTYSGNVSQANNADMIAVTGGHATGTVTFQTGTLNATNGTGLRFDNADGTYNFNGTTTMNGGDAGIDITNGSAGLFTFSGNISVTNPSGAAFVISGGTAALDYNGTLSKNNSGRLIDIQNHATGAISFDGNLSSTGSSTGILVNGNTGGLIFFTGGTKTINTGSAAGVTLTGNSGVTINFTGSGLAITTTSGAGFSATGGGTVTVQGTGNSINSTSATALNVANTTIGASGLTFQSITSNGGSATGIILDNTGTGGLTVTGTGGAGSGGTIANKTGTNGSNTTGVGIYLNNCANVSLTRMQLNNFGNFGIRGFTVNNFTMDNCVVNHSSGKNGDDDATDEGSIYFGAENPGGTNGLTGTVSITNCFIEDGYENNFKIANLSGTLSQLTMTNCTIRDNSIASPGNNGFEIRAQGSANITADITNSTFTGNRANGIQVTTTPEHTGTVDVEIGVAGVASSGGTFTNNNIGINIAHGSPGILNFDIHRGTFNSSPGLASPININLAAGLAGGVGPMSGSITNNAITNANSGTGPGIRVTTNGTDADQSNVLTIQISSNNISQIGNRGIEMIARDGNSTLNATVTNNTVTLTDPLAADAIRIDAGTSSGDLTTVCLAISGNTATTIVGSNGIRIRNRFAGTTFRLPGYGGAATDPDGTHEAVIAHLAALNPATPVITADHAVGNTGFIPGGAPCATPN